MQAHGSLDILFDSRTGFMNVLPLGEHFLKILVPTMMKQRLAVLICFDLDYNKLYLTDFLGQNARFETAEKPFYTVRLVSRTMKKEAIRWQCNRIIKGVRQIRNKSCLLKYPWNSGKLFQVTLILRQKMITLSLSSYVERIWRHRTIWRQRWYMVALVAYLLAFDRYAN